MNKKDTHKHSAKRAEYDELDSFDQEFREFMNEYTVEYPGEEAIMQTIDTLRPYVKQPEVRRKTGFPFSLAMLKMLHIRTSFWLLNALFFVGGLLAWGVWEGNPYSIMLLLSPVPFLLGLLEVFRGRDEGLMELEMSCKYSAQQIMLSKMLVIGSYNLLLSFILLIIFGLFGEPLLLSKIIIFWVTPFTAASSIGLAVANRVRSMISIPFTLTIWIFIVPLVIEFTKSENIDGFYTGVGAAVSIFAVLMFVLQIKRLRRGEFVDIIH